MTNISNPTRALAVGQLKKYKIIYWISTGLIAAWELSGAFFMNSELAKEGMRHLGLPDWLRWEVSIGHLIGGILLIVPIPKRIKEWVYVAFGIDFISAFIAYLSIDGITGNNFSPLIFLGILIVSYVYYHKLKNVQND
ncbi:MAG TPA: DoxX family protein [Hanamia sp.]|nr:DoxX family protein [Hanamia sp.]